MNLRSVLCALVPNSTYLSFFFGSRVGFKFYDFQQLHPRLFQPVKGVAEPASNVCRERISVPLEIRPCYGHHGISNQG